MIDITSVFGPGGIDFFGHNNTSLYINNNGNLTFNSPWSGYTPSSIAGGISGPIIAAFWADVWTYGPNAGTSPGGHSTGSDLVWWDLDAVNGVMTITWDDVAYYSNGHLPNAFQIQLINEGYGNFDIVYRYESINWTAGNASGGSGGLGGTTARAGYNAQDGVHYFELPQSGNQAQMLALPDTPGNTGIPGVDVFSVRSGGVVSVDLTDTGVIAFSDVDRNDLHLVSTTGAPVGATLGRLTVVEDSDTTGTGTGGQLTWTYTVADSAVQFLAAGETRIESFIITLDDQQGGLITRQIDITITGSEQGVSVDSGPVILSDALQTVGDAFGGATISHLSILDGYTDDLTITVVAGDGTLTPVGSVDDFDSVDDGSDGTMSATGSLAAINQMLADGLTYAPDNDTPPVNDMVTLTIDDGDHTDSLHFIFNVTGQDPTLFATARKDIIYATGGHDQFVFMATAGTGHDTIIDFTPGQDAIELDYNAFDPDLPSNFNAWLADHATVHGADVLIDLNVGDLHPNQDTILLRNVSLASLSANDFILPSGGGVA